MFPLGKITECHISGAVLKLIPVATPLRFLMAVVAAFTISFSIASMASMTGYLPQAKVDPQAPSFITPLAKHLQNAAMTAAKSASTHSDSAAIGSVPAADKPAPSIEVAAR
jgi:hypothetical protein